jgi:hypothetical protein
MIRIRLTEEQRRLVEVEQGGPVEVIDPATGQAYVLIARDQFDRVQALLEQPPTVDEKRNGVSPGVLRSQQAYWRDLPELLKLKFPERQWVAYHGEQRVGFSSNVAELYLECERRGIPASEFYVDRVEPLAFPPWEAEEVVI